MEESLDYVEREENHEYAGFGVRLAALFIDGILIMLLCWLLFGEEVVKTDNGFMFELRGWRNIVVYAYYFLFWVTLSSSPGKMLLGLRIIDDEGNNIGPFKALIRTLIYILLIIGGWFILGTEKKQGLHDLAAGTFVVKTRK